jgi:sucrose-6F-phosphate phosphohydrolase
MPDNESYLLVSDVDDTLLGDDQGLALFSQWCESNRDWLRIAYASGRFVDSLLDSVRNEGLPSPDALIGGVGTQIMAYPSCDVFGGWIDTLGRKWDAAQIRDLLAGDSDLTPQPDEFQSDYKLSYFLYDAPPEHLVALRRRLAQAGLDAEFVYSSHRDLDMLPAGVNKGAAAAFLARRWEFPGHRVLVSGNSANDASMFLDEFRGVVVANAHDELKALAGDNVYLASQGHALGVLEGIEHWLAQTAGVCAADEQGM